AKCLAWVCRSGEVGHLRDRSGRLDGPPGPDPEGKVEPLHLCQGRGQRRMGGGVERLVACDGARLALRVCKFTDCVETCFEPAMKVAGRLAQAGQYGRRACPDVQLHDASFDWAQRADCFGLCNPAKGWTAS